MSTGRTVMFHRRSIRAIAFLALCICAQTHIASSQVASPQAASPSDASKYDPVRYPDWSGLMRWTARGGNRYDQTKTAGRAQQAPLTAEYQALFEAGLKDQAGGGQGANQTYSCLPGGLPRDMAGNQGTQILVHPEGNACT